MVILKVRNASGTFVDIPAIVGPKGDTGISISTITKTATSGLTDTYTITFSDGHTSTYVITNGAKGDKGDTGEAGTITSVSKTSTSGLVDTYTITYSDNTTSTFTVTNGKDAKSPQIKNNTWWTYNDTTGQYEDTGTSVSSAYILTKANIESVFTGDITSHTHDSLYLAINGTAVKATSDSAGQQINTTYIKGLSISGATITYTKGDGTTGTITVPTYSDVTTTTHGLMSAVDKVKLDGIETGAQVNTVTSVSGRTGAIVLTKNDVGLSNVDNTADANKTVLAAANDVNNLPLIDANIKYIDAAIISPIVLTDATGILTELYSYGVEWTIGVSDPHLTRVGNSYFHKALPIQSQFRGCVEKDGNIQYYLGASNWKYKEDGTTLSVLDGTDGNLQVHTPRWYIKSYMPESGTAWVRQSNVYIDNTWTVVPEMVLDPDGACIDRTDTSNLKLCDVVNTTATYRGGGNRSSYDSYLETDPYRTDLGKRITSISRITGRQYARNAGRELMNLFQYQCIFYWCPVIEYATFNLQDTYNPELTSDGYHQGGLGSGLTAFTTISDQWSSYNGYYPLTPCGLGSEYGNSSASITIPAITYKVNTIATASLSSWTWTASNTFTNSSGTYTITNVANKTLATCSWYYAGATSTFTITGVSSSLYLIFSDGTIVNADGTYTIAWPTTSTATRSISTNATGSCNITIVMTATTNTEMEVTTGINYVARYRGINNLFGDIWNIVDGIIIQKNSDNTNHTVYATDNPANYNDSDVSVMENVGTEIGADGWIKEFTLGTKGWIIPASVGGSFITFKSDYHYQTQSTALRGLLLGGLASAGTAAGPGCFLSYYGVGCSSAYIGLRSIRLL